MVHVPAIMTSILGGCCFYPDSMADGLKLFEMETVLSVRERKLPPALPPVGSDVSDGTYTLAGRYPVGIT